LRRISNFFLNVLDASVTKINLKSTSESNSRLNSVIKGITRRIVGTIDTLIIAWLMTGKMGFALSISFVEVFTKMLPYYLHDRAWISILRKQKKDN
jgi:uncharacterized membrane protein